MTEQNREIIDALQQAKWEIQRLRRDNEILYAKVSTMELLGQFLNAKVRRKPEDASVDIVWSIDRLVRKIEDEQKVASKREN